MLFNSYVYIFAFLPLVWSLYVGSRILGFQSLKTILLIFASIAYYAYWNPWHLLLLLPSVGVNYFLGSSLAKRPSSKLLSVGIILNLLPLLFFKYFNFLAENLALLLGSEATAHHYALPLAISFFTFQQIAFLVDSYKGIAKEYDFLRYCLFVVFFPQLIAGPIVHHQEMMPQFSRQQEELPKPNVFAQGIFLFVIGLGKKVIIADSLSPYVQSGFDAGHSLNFLEAWFACLSYTLQLYFDFSGYSDMALGSALLFGIRLPINFNSPYKSRNIQEFWRRWHCTLGRWLKDYVYVPLGGNRGSTAHITRNLMLTFIIGGIWHGAGWNFLIWGTLHGAAMVLHRFCALFSLRFPALLSWILTMLLVMISWVFFRATSFSIAVRNLESMFPAALFNPMEWIPSCTKFIQRSSNSPAELIPHLTANPLVLGACIIIAVLIAICAPNSNQIVERFDRFPRMSAVFAAAVFALSLLLLERQSEFLYFQF